MKNFDRVVNLLRQAKTFFFATVDDDKPNVRPFNAVVQYNGKVYFYTNNHKHAFNQMQKNRNIELCAMIDDDRWIRVSGKVVFDYSVEAKKAMLDANPELKKIYNENDKIFEVFYLSNLQAKIHSTYQEAETIC